MDILRQKVKADKKLVIAENLNLTDAEGASFWPVSTHTRRACSRSTAARLGRGPCVCRRVRQGPVPDATAKKLIEEAMAVDDAEEAKLKGSLSAAKILARAPGREAARYLQIENKIRAVVRYELAAGIPLVE
jgi:hypothetical protein